MHEYLEALADWIQDSDGCYLNDQRRRTPPRSGWEVFDDALRAANNYGVNAHDVRTGPPTTHHPQHQPVR